MERRILKGAPPPPKNDFPRSSILCKKQSEPKNWGVDEILQVIFFPRIF